MKNVPFPMFELAGPPCEDPGCKGVLVDHVSTKTQDFFRRCSICKRESHRTSAREKLAWVRRVIGRALRGEKES